MGTREAVSVGRGDGCGDDLVLEIACEHAAGLLAIARRHSLCTDDAHDAYQRAMEILLRRAASLERATALNWMRTVVKHEAMAVRAARQASVSTLDPGLDEHEAVALPSADERAARLDRLGRAAEALQRLKPQEVRALLLKAEGHSYEEICSITGWTYTKVNRCLTEGRRAFRARYATIESGQECERWAPLLSTIADGEADADDVLAARPHLRACPACRAALRDYRLAAREVAALVPVAALAGAGTGVGPSGALSAVVARVHEAVAGVGPQKVQAALDAAWSGKVAAIAASTVALAGGGVAVEREVSRLSRPRPAVPREARGLARHRAPAARIVAGAAAATQPRSSLGAPAGVVGHPVPRVGRPAAATTRTPRPPRTGATSSSSARRSSAAGEFAPEGPAPVPRASSPTAPSPGSTSARTASAASPATARSRSSSGGGGNGAEFGF